MEIIECNLYQHHLHLLLTITKGGFGNKVEWRLFFLARLPLTKFHKSNEEENHLKGQIQDEFWGSSLLIFICNEGEKG